MISSIFGGASSLREKQISSLKAVCPTITEKSKNSAYELSINQTYTLRVVLPSNFPKDPPHLQILPPTLRSSFIDPIGKVLPTANENLRLWNPQRSLGDTVVSVAKLLQSETNTSHQPRSSPNYPHMSSGVPPAYASATLPVNYSSPQYSNQHLHNPASTPALSPTSKSPYSSNTSSVRGSSTFAEVENLSEQRIQQLLNEPRAFDDFFHEMSCVRMLEAAKEESRGKNLEHAKKNLEKEKQMKEAQHKLTVVSQHLSELRNEYEQLSTQQASLMKQYSPSLMYDKLADAVDEAEEKSENIVNDYNDAKISINEFISQYFEERKIYHLRKAKLECIGK